MAEDDFQYALSSNNAWASYKSHQNPQWFKNLAASHSPRILWLGCSDARIPETIVLGLQPGDVLAHRNIGNIVSATDINLCAVIEHAVINLHVQHIVLCGHTSCDMVDCVVKGDKLGGVLDTWLTSLRTLRYQHGEQLESLRKDELRCQRLAEMNVDAGVNVLKGHWAVREAMKGRGLAVHGCMYDVGSGRLRDLTPGQTKGVNGTNGHSEDQLVRGNHGMLVFRNGNASMHAR